MYAKTRYSFCSDFLTAIMVQIFILGLCVTFYPIVRGFVVDRVMENNANDFLIRLEETAPTEQPEEILVTLPEETEPIEETRPHEDLWNDMVAYNERIYQQHQTGLSCEYDYQRASFILKDYGLEDEIFGVISIPAMELEMPIYLGATEQHMADGAAHMTQTSIPIGGINTNAVIAGHRGYSGASYFRYIEKLKPGDLVTVRNLWETLNYRVSSIKIIDPHDVEKILIQDGRELLTLLSCHPYASGGKQRYVVYCERIPNP